MNLTFLIMELLMILLKTCNSLTLVFDHKWKIISEYIHMNMIQVITINLENGCSSLKTLTLQVREDILAMISWDRTRQFVIKHFPQTQNSAISEQMDFQHDEIYIEQSN